MGLFHTREMALWLTNGWAEKRLGGGLWFIICCSDLGAVWPTATTNRVNGFDHATKIPRLIKLLGKNWGFCLGDRVHHCHLHSLGTKNCCSSITYYSKLAKLYLGLQQVVEYPPSTVSWFVGPLHSLHLQASQPSEHVQVQWWESEGSSWYLSNSPAPPSPWHLVA